MTRTITQRIVRPIWLTCFALIVALATTAASAQGPPDPPAGPRDKSRDPAAEKKDDFRPGMPDRRFGPQWPGPAARGRGIQPAAPARLDELEAKLDTLLDEVRQLRRDIQRLHANLQPGARGPQFGPPFYPGPYRGGFHPGAQWAPWGPHFKGPQGAFGPPWAGPGRGPQAMRDWAPRGPRDKNADRGTDRPRGDSLKRDPDRPKDDQIDRRRPDGPRRERDDVDRDREDRDPDGRGDGDREDR